MRAWVTYAGVSAVILGALALGVVLVVPGTHAGSVWLAAAVALAVQVAAFAVLIAARRQQGGFVAGWGGGMLLRFGSVAGMAVWVTVSDGPHAESALLSLIGFIMVLVLIEPLFLRLAD
jgi:Na+/proline symporter